MPGLLPHVDPDGLLEFSVVYTDRALNHMSARFRRVMLDIGDMLKEVYGAHSAVLVPGSGTFGMESVARQFAGGQKVLILRNGWFSFRWSQILEMGAITPDVTVLKARRTGAGPQAPWAPAPIEEVLATIRAEKPAVVFAPHVETASGMILPDDYLRSVAEAVHEVGGLFVLDCIASGAMWVDMQATGVDVLVSAPQKGWSSSPCCAMVMLGERARTATGPGPGSARSCNLTSIPTSSCAASTTTLRPWPAQQPGEPPPGAATRRQTPAVQRQRRRKPRRRQPHQAAGWHNKLHKQRLDPKQPSMTS